MIRPETIAKGIQLYPGECTAALAGMDAASVDSCVTDPPYHLTSIVKRFGADNAAPAKSGKTGAYKRASAGFMGKQWDGGDVAFRVETWLAVWRVLKPGAHLVAFSGTRTYHRMVCAIEDAGFEIRDQIGWAYGSGFPKSHNQRGDWQGWGTALKPAWEPVVLARKPLIGTVAANIAEHGTGALNIDGCRVEFAGTNDAAAAAAAAAVGFAASRARGTSTQSNSIGKESRDGTNTYDPFALKGRWPANIIHDGSEEVVGAFPDTGQSGVAVQRNGGGQKIGNTVYSGSGGGIIRPDAGFADGGSAARFFYTAKADADDRLGSKHPTVKPIDLMQWLVRLVTPPGGLVLDPFAGTGTTGEAAFREGMRAVLIEREPEYQADIRRRMSLVLGGPEERQRESIKARGLTADAGPLFGGSDTTRGGADKSTATSRTRTNDRTDRIEMVKP